MYDTLHIFGNYDKPISQLERTVDLRSEVRINTGEEVLKGTFKNFSIMQNAKNISLKGSIAKYFFDGSNLETLTRKDTKEAVEKLSDDLGFKIQDSKVTRIDIGTNFIMKEEYKTYFKQLGDLKSFDKSVFKGSLYYGNGTKQLIFYEKLLDLEKKKIPVPSDIRAYKGRVLRYECRIKARVSRAFGMGVVKASDLYKDKFYKKVVDKWNEHYLNINKLQKLRFKDMAIENMNVKLFEAELMLKGIEQIGGIDEALSLVEHSRGKLNRVQLSRLKNKIRSLNKHKELTEPQETILELDAKIKRVAEQYQ